MHWGWWWISREHIQLMEITHWVHKPTVALTLGDSCWRPQAQVKGRSDPGPVLGKEKDASPENTGCPPDLVEGEQRGSAGLLLFPWCRISKVTLVNLNLSFLPPPTPWVRVIQTGSLNTGSRRMLYLLCNDEHTERSCQANERTAQFKKGTTRRNQEMFS